MAFTHFHITSEFWSFTIVVIMHHATDARFVMIMTKWQIFGS